jgi:hypothetical protein
MILKEIYLYPDLVDFHEDVVNPFRDQSRSICNYLERQLKPIKFKTEGFKRICFIGKTNPEPGHFINSSNVLIVEVRFDEQKYKTLGTDQLNEFFYEMLKSGIEKCQEQCDISGGALLDALKSFQENGWQNKWIFKEKSIKAKGVKCALECELTINNFQLHLVFYRLKERILSRKILTTEPDEIVFSHLFKDISIDGEILVILDRFGNAIYSEKLENLG